MNKSYWAMYGVQDLNRKKEGKGVMYAVFKDEVTGCAYNDLSEEDWIAYEQQRSTVDATLGPEKYKRPALHMHEYGGNKLIHF